MAVSSFVTASAGHIGAIVGLFAMSVTNTSNSTERSPDRRRLAAVVHMDMMGYSRLIGLDDVGTLDRLRILRREVIDPAIAEQGGRIVQTGGDSLLIVFDSIDGAVRCAVKVQQQVPSYDGDYGPDRTIRFRIGINFGDAIPDGTDLHGDMVNVAARLQAECPPGGICVTRAVRDHVQDRLNLMFEELGALDLKNIARPVEAFVLRSDGTARPESAGRSLLHNTREALPLPDRPSIAVLAFANMSGDAEQEYFSDGVAEDIITELSRCRWLFVIARNSSFTYKGHAVDIKQVARELGVRYILEGSVRRSSDRVRVTAQLIEAETTSHIWAERYDRKLTDVFAVQDEITAAVVSAILPAVSYVEQQRALRRPPENLGAWEAYQRGLWHRLKFKLDDMPRAREFFVRAIELDPTLAAAYTGLAWLYLVEAHWFGSLPFAEGAVLAAEQARKAIEIDPDDAEAYGVLASALFSSGDFKAASDYAQRALSISPSCAFAQHTRGAILLFSGQPMEAREILSLARRLDPRLLGAVIQVQIAMSYYYVSDYEDAVSTLRGLLSERPDQPWAYRWLAAALGQLGRTDEARDALSKAIATAPEAFYVFLRNRPPWVRPEDYEHMLDGLRKAGWQG